jgi:hypothetical protein
MKKNVETAAPSAVVERSSTGFCQQRDFKDIPSKMR